MRKRKKYSEAALMRAGWGISQRVDGTGPLVCVKRARRCQSKSFLAGQCRGVHGHKGPHWCYRDSGWLERWGDKSKPRIAHESTPPGHPRYVEPAKMLAHDVSSHGKRMVIQRSQFIEKRVRKGK